MRFGRRTVGWFLLSMLVPAVSDGASPQRAVDLGADCRAKGKALWGRVQVVEHFPDLDVQVVEHFPDLKVKWVEHFPDACGRWQEVEHFPDLKIRYVEHFPDLKIQVVEHFPGLP